MPDCECIEEIEEDFASLNGEMLAGPRDGLNGAMTWSKTLLTNPHSGRWAGESRYPTTGLKGMTDHRRRMISCTDKWSCADRHV